MNNFKISRANLKDPHISSLRMPHFKIAHISTLLATVPQSVGNTTNYQLLDLLTVHTNSQLYYNSFLPSAVRDWNELPEYIHVRNLQSITTFKNELNSEIKKIPKFYFAGKRLGQIYHSRLRTKCGSLNQHLFSKNIVESPLCVCGALEDTNHFLFNCERFHN